ncbi:MAG: hypothetical protein ACTS22_08435 [Phycisphaerales bacterium]
MNMSSFVRVSPLLLVAAMLLLTGCGHYARVSLAATEGDAVLRPGYQTAAYTFTDENTVDLYLSDLTPDELGRPWSDQGRPVGQITHIHMFIRPRPGRTPIDPNASNATIRHLILAPEGATGIYAGGGFLLPSSSAASGTFKGSIKSGTLALDAASLNFTDALGAARFRASLKVRRDDELARTIALRLAEAARTVR